MLRSTSGELGREPFSPALKVALTPITSRQNLEQLAIAPIASKGQLLPCNQKSGELHMRKLLTTTAIAATLGVIAASAQAQTSSGAGATQEPASAPADRCDSEWHLVDDDSDGFVTREEADGLLKDLFTLMDSNRNGEITKTEYVDCIAQTSDDTPPAEATRDEESFTTVDANQDDSIDPEEFRTGAEQAYQDSRSSTEAQADPVIVLRRFVWLTPDELSSGAHGEMSADEAAWRSAQTFQGLDTDANGRLSNDEWAQSQATPGPIEQTVASRYERLDTDGSGSVSEQEFKQAQTAMLDDTDTGSVTTSGDAQADASASGGAEASAPADPSGETDGIPVFIYHFRSL